MTRRLALVALAALALVAAVRGARELPLRGRALLPAPLLSRGRPVVSRPPGGQAVVDGVYRGGASWSGGRPTPARPSWVAIDVGRGPTRVLVAWTSSGNHDYLDRKYGAPVDYRIETSADSTDGSNGAWRTALTVEGNPARTRAHAVDFAGQRWVRLVVTGLAPDVFEWGLYVDEIDVHDLSRGGNDVWVFFGDSITSAVFDRAPGRQPSFAEAVAWRHRGYFPAMIGAGFGSLHHDGAVKRIDEVLALNPDARVFAILIGSNDWDPVAYRADLLEMIRKVRAAGAIPVVARIPYRSDSRVDFAARLDEVIDEVAAQEGLLPGPDLHGWFRAHPEHLTDGLHPDDEGAREVIRRWVDASTPLYR